MNIYMTNSTPWQQECKISPRLRHLSQVTYRGGVVVPPLVAQNQVCTWSGQQSTEETEKVRGKESAQVGAAAIAAPWTWAKKIGIECHHRQERAGAAGGAVLGRFALLRIRSVRCLSSLPGRCKTVDYRLFAAERKPDCISLTTSQSNQKCTVPLSSCQISDGAIDGRPGACKT